MDPFVVPRTTFTVYRKLVQFPFEVGLRLLGRGGDDRAEATAGRTEADVVEKPRRRPAQRRRRTTANSKGRAAKSSGQTASRRGRAASSRQRQTGRRGQTQRQTVSRHRRTTERTRKAPERATEATGRTTPATAHSEAETLRALQDVQERIEGARGEVGASQRERPEQRPTEAAAPDEARGDSATQGQREHGADRPGTQPQNGEPADQN